MSPHAKRILDITVGLAICAGLASAQPTRQPARPELPAGADRNDPWTYYRIGQSSVKQEPDKAADAFYWAARLNPVWAEAYYGRRVALLLHDRRRLARYLSGDRGVTKSKEAMEIDSLYLYAFTLNPFLGPQLEHLLVEAMIEEISTRAGNQSGGSPLMIASSLKNYINGSPAWGAVMAYSDGRYDEALSLYAKAVSRARDRGGCSLSEADCSTRWGSTTAHSSI